MTIRPILVWPHPMLRQKAQPVRDFGPELAALAAGMAATMYASDGIGLAAPQVGVLQRVIVIDPARRGERSRLFTLVNPVITELEGEAVWSEACLSVPGVTEDMVRAARVRVEAQNLEGEPVLMDCSVEQDGILAIALQHEIDHLDGVSFPDRLSRLKQEGIKRQLRRRDAGTTRQRAAVT